MKYKTMLLYFLIICATEFLIVNYGSYAAGIINITTTKNDADIAIGPVKSHTTYETTNYDTPTTILKAETAMENVLSIIKGQKPSTTETSARKVAKATTSNPSTLVQKQAAEIALSSLTREARTLRRLFPLLRNATAAPGLFGDNGLLPLLLTNLLSNDNVGVIAAGLISALRDRVTTTAATTAAATGTTPVNNTTNNFYSTPNYPYYYGGQNYYAPYGYYYG
ncbi:uncharacterized protein LOC126750772 [Bactrocera neohumeralis]|uniref:uncharacterized protein LOC126750772 n=1 Tax=Bactrocera neohumeralis TaxID=98809 RepID=UPI0021657875|nr:uncharacterized protein LOC126750772 [Bactrocera neohumeralis]